MQYIYGDIFPLLKTIFELVILMLFCASTVFCFTSSTLAKHFPLRTFFNPGEQHQSHLGDDWVNREGGAWSHVVFGQKLLNTPHSVGRCACKSPFVKWANVLKESSQNTHWIWKQPLASMPAGTLIQMGSWNIHLVGEASTTRGLPSRR